MYLNSCFATIGRTPKRFHCTRRCTQPLGPLHLCFPRSALTSYCRQPIDNFTSLKLEFARKITTRLHNSTNIFTPVIFEERKQEQCNVKRRDVAPLLFAILAFTVPFIKRKKESETDKDLVKEKTLPVDGSPSPARIISPEELAKHKSVDDGGVWVSLRGKVYDVTKFVDIHPGGNKILLAAGGDVSPYWALYAFHYEDHVLDILKDYYIGDLPEEYRSEEPTEMGPFANEPERHPALTVLSKQPHNAETPSALIPDHLITPNELFFVRNHFPVPDLDTNTHRLHLVIPDPTISTRSSVNVSLCVDELKENYPKHSILSTMICAGNRRSDMAADDSERATIEGRKPYVHGLGWKHAAASTALWTGVKLVDLLARHWLPEDQQTNYDALLASARKAGFSHVQFEGSDTDVEGAAFGASLPIEWALDPQMDVLIAYEMNGQPLPRDHGYPLRVVVPGCIGARQVKWLRMITLSSEESPSFYQREDYKIVYPIRNGEIQSPSNLPAILDFPVQSAICEPLDNQVLLNEGSITVRGYAFSGGGRGILSVRVTSDNGATWHDAHLKPISPPAGIDPSRLPPDDPALAHRTKRQWAWTLWEAEIPVEDDADCIELACCARDSSNAVQPQTCIASLNVRGLLTNSWHRIRVRLKRTDEQT